MKEMNIIRFLLQGMLISIFITSACDPMNPLVGNPKGIRTVFNIYGIPGETNPPTFSKIDWAWEDKLTIQGFSTGDPFYPGFIGDVATRNILPFRLNNSSLDGSLPLISRDGRYLTFQSEGKLYIVTMDRLVTNNYSITSASYVDILDTEFQCDNLAWSPDSIQLASVCQTSGKVTVSLYDLAKKSFQDVFEYSEEYIGEIEEGVSWSSDGTMLAFALRYDYIGRPPQTDIFVYYIDERLLTRITKTPGDDERNPDWYPGSKVLTFSSAMKNTLQVDANLVFSTEDGKCKKLLPTLKGFVYPSWSPDGSQLAYIDHWMDIKIIDIYQFVQPNFLSPDGLCNSK